MERNCSLEAQKLGLDDQERQLIEKNFDEGLKENKKLQNLIEENKIAQEQLKGIRLEKKDQAAIDKKGIDGYTEVINRKKEELKNLEGEDKKLAQQELKGTRSVKRDASEARTAKIKDYNESIRALMASKKAMSEQRKELQKFIKDTQTKIVKNYVRKNADAVRKSIVLQHVADGKLSFKDIFDPAYQTPHSLLSINQRISNTLGDNTSDIIEKAMLNPNDYKDEFVKKLHDHLVVGVNNEAKSLGVLEKHGLETGQRPFAEHYDAVRSKFFLQSASRRAKEALGAKSILDEDGFKDYVTDWKAALGEEHLNELIEKAYENSSKIPTIEEAFKDLRNDLIQGRLPKLKFTNPKFLDDAKYEYMVKKYSGKTIVGNLITFAKRKVNELSISEATGGYLTDHQFTVDRKITDKMRAYYKDIMKDGYGEQIGTSAGRYARKKILNNYGRLAVATRPLTMYLSPIGDRAVGAALTNMERDNFTIATLPKEMISGAFDIFSQTKRMFRQGEAKDTLNDATKLFSTYAEASEQRYAIEDSPLTENGFFDKTFGRLATASINHFHIQDNALRVVNAKDFTNYVNEHAKVPFDKLPTSYKGILENQHGINKNDWQEIKKVAKTNEIITSDKFKGSLANKVASIEVTSNLRAMPNEFPLAPALGAKVRQYAGETAYRAITQFWGFTLKTSIYGFRNAYSTKGAWGVANWSARLMARGFVPGLALTGLFTLARTGSLDETIKEMQKPSTILDSFIGIVSRPLQILSLFYNQNDAAYKVSTPLLRDAWGTVRAIRHGGAAIIDGDQRKAAGEALGQFLSMSVPGWAQTPAKSHYKDWVKEDL